MADDYVFKNHYQRGIVKYLWVRWHAKDNPAFMYVHSWPSVSADSTSCRLNSICGWLYPQMQNPRYKGPLNYAILYKGLQHL